ncbi:hypothetical protein FALBO_10790 [Fusarium albosuccineum]|uniref:Uncharacterized protein n=1 Tax=Fusarium albosuccineum TaxID=1237068 RepID=A0A8H4L5D6_9HYPO|nr:hypothetical protein FALBO_10790 [Fusarium albosuccineum]
MSASIISQEIDHDARFRRDALEGFDADVLEVSTDKDKQELLTSIQSFSFHFIKEALRRSEAESDTVQQGFDVLWHMFIGAAKAFGKDSLFQDRLVLLLAWTKEFDGLHKGLNPENSVASTWESYGFANSLQESWEQLLSTGTVFQQCGLATFSAKALTAGICSDSIGKSGLWFLSNALETHDEAMAVTLLPAAVIWVDHCRHRFLALSVHDQGHEDSSNTRLLACGPLARQKGIDQPGFSLKRWLFWRQRFQQLSRSSDLAVAKEAKKGFMATINCGRDFDYDVPGEAKFAERLQAAMWEALVESGKESLDGDEIDINPDWVD